MLYSSVRTLSTLETVPFILTKPLHTAGDRWRVGVDLVDRENQSAEMPEPRRLIPCHQVKEREGSLFLVQNSVEWKQRAFPDSLPGRELTWRVLSRLCSISQVLVEMLLELSGE